ncbi:MAG TPA: TetR/AcrR family transcriptional regulator [Solirubrobacteraceae bacterium]|jgi:AcrR family transcriptional regulator
MGRPKEHDEATRRRLLDAAEHLSATHGWEALTVRRIAEEAGTSTRAVYALFGSKEGLEQALHQAMFTRLRDLLRASERSDDPRRDIAVQALAYRQWAVERPERYALAMHRFVGQQSRPRSDEGLAVSREALGELRNAVRRCHDAGLLLGDRDPEDVVTHLRAMAHGLAEFENLGLLGPDPEAQWMAAVSAQLDGYVHPDAAAA